MKTHLWFAIGLVTGLVCAVLAAGRFTITINHTGATTNTVALELKAKPQQQQKGPTR